MEDSKAYQQLLSAFPAGVVQSPLEIKAKLAGEEVLAELKDTGYVTFNEKVFDNLDQLTNALNVNGETSSNPLQIWAWYNPERDAWAPLEHIRAEMASASDTTVKTSETHPLRVDAVAVPGYSGNIGLTFCPGKCSKGLYGGIWQRDLNSDLQAIRHWGGKALVTLMEDHEFALLGVPDFAQVLQQHELEWFHLPIPDMNPPSASFEILWLDAGPKLHAYLAAGESIVIHCRGGLGRTGLLAARVMVEQGVQPAEAVREVREARPNSIETYAQEMYVLEQQWKS